jgi:hypothetical protein
MKAIKISLIVAIAVSFISVWNTSCQKDVARESKANLPEEVATKKPDNPGFAENNMVMYWNDKVATVLSAPMTQPTRSRYFAIIEIAVHDALNNIKPKFQRYALLNEREQFASPDAAVASAAYWAIKGLNRQGSFPIDTWYSESLATIPDGESKELGKTLGKHAAEAIIANRANDGFTQVLATSVNPPDGTTPGAYRHTNLLNVRYVPNWGTVMSPYVIASNDQFRPIGPHAVTSAEYAADYNEVKAKGARVGSSRNTEDETLARFWADNKPSIVWNNFARNILATKKMDAWKTARLFAIMHTAIADGVNSALEAAYHFYSWRPETALREGDNDNNTATTGDGSWIPFIIEGPNANPVANFVSPPIPEYPATYSVNGGIVAEVLQLFFETDKIEIDLTSITLPGTTLHYSSISRAARDNSLSKIYEGWHFRKAVIDGEALGKSVGNYVFNHHFQESID